MFVSLSLKMTQEKKKNPFWINYQSGKLKGTNGALDQCTFFASICAPADVPITFEVVGFNKIEEQTRCRTLISSVCSHSSAKFNLNVISIDFPVLTVTVRVHKGNKE